MSEILFLMVFLGVLTLLTYPLGRYMSKVFEGGPIKGLGFMRPLENGVYKLIGVDPQREMGWKAWAGALVILTLLKFVIVFLILVFQNLLPFNPQNLPGVPWDTALNTAISFITNTNWQNYAGEATMSYFSQMAALGVQNFLSAAMGIVVVVALIRGLTRREQSTLGNVWVDLVRTTLYILLPLSFFYGIFLLSQGVIQNYNGYLTAQTIAGGTQILPGGPVASQEAIKILGTNGGGFFNANSSHPWENPNTLTSFTQLISMFLIPGALVFAFGRMVKDLRQSWAIYTVMATLFVVFTMGAFFAESAPAGGNWEGKETRFGIENSVTYATVTTSTSTGSVNSAHDSYTPLGGAMPLVLMQLGEVVFGGVGSGLYGMLAMVLLTVFVGGLMVGRTPEYLGKKIEPYDMKMIVIAVMVTPLLVLLGTATAALWPDTIKSVTNPGPHGLTEVLYAFTSAGNNNGSAFGGFNGATVFFNLILGAMMLFGRFLVIIPILALAGNLAKKRILATGQGTVPTHSVTFNILLIGFILIVGALNYIPALALGPLADFFQTISIGGA